MQVELIETKRLRGERVQKSHWQHWLKIGFNPQFMKNMGGIWNYKKAQQKMQCNSEQWEFYGQVALF